ncbi:MAG: prephenate dehydratase [Chloroflexi bacterium]|uniref:prephenate dehydratase n=1 Tax=Candidatus Flexifilum breve TaxID=3140694 RepID=UPI003136DA1D|nr:prephenate dehydratase [Chloroflexota bacterium]MBK9749967.1 prephenate dehydratase [Chloroflexota bacterium]
MEEIILQECVAFQGIHGAYSEQAIRQHFGDTVTTYPTPTLSDLFETMQSRKVKYAMLPVENALAGAVNQAYELLMDSDLRIQAEVILHVHHALHAPKGVTIDQIKRVRSHPQALAQCDKFLKRHKIEPVPWYDTAGSAKDLAAETADGETGAIASALAGKLYGLDTLASEIEDVPFNFTRFFLLADDDPQHGEFNKTSLVFATRNRPAALYECLGEFAQRGINLTKIESRPRRNRPWEPIFFLDIEGHWQDQQVQEALARLLQRASFVKMLGSYPAVKNQSVGI